MTRTKICGLCNAADAVMSASAGADYLGVILAQGRTRSRTIQQAREIFGAFEMQRVGVFVNAAVREMADAADALDLAVIQLHGEESVADVKELRSVVASNAKLWKAVRVRSAADVIEARERYGDGVDALLLDGWSDTMHGGAGVRFDWDAIAQVRGTLPSSLQLVVAGGLTPANVAGVIELLRPDIVDVSSGVEDSPCSKSAVQVREFIAAAKSAGNKNGYR